MRFKINGYITLKSGGLPEVHPDGVMYRSISFKLAEGEGKVKSIEYILDGESLALIEYSTPIRIPVNRYCAFRYFRPNNAKSQITVSHSPDIERAHGHMITSKITHV